MIKDIHPRTPISQLQRDYSKDQLAQMVDADLALAVSGLNRSFARRALGKSVEDRIALRDVLSLLELDAFGETFVPRSRVPAYLLERAEVDAQKVQELRLEDEHALVQGNALDLIPRIVPGSVPTIVTSTPYWGMRLYQDAFSHQWADGESCPLGNEQTPEGFVRHTIEVLHALRRVLRKDGSVWWNLMDSYNTRTQIRSNASETLNAMRGNDSRGWKDHHCRRYSAGHAYLKDGEQCLIPAMVAARASRIGYFVKSTVAWKKNGSLPETVSTRVTRELEYIFHFTVDRAPRFDKTAFRSLPAKLGGRNMRYEAEKITDVWHFSTASGLDGHGAQFPVALPGRCIALTSRPGDVILDPFVGSGSTSVAAALLGRRSLGFDVSSKYLAIARKRLDRVASDKNNAAA